MPGAAPGAAMTPLTGGCEAHRAAEPLDRRRRRNIRDAASLVLDGAAETRPGFGKTFVNDRQQRPGVNGLRRQRAAPSSSAMRRKSGAGESRLAKAYPDIATRGTVGARSWNILIDLKPRMCGMKMSTSIRSKPGIFQRTKRLRRLIGCHHIEP